MSRHPYDILIRPLLTEKATRGSDDPKHPQYTFKVALGSNEIQIRRAVEAAFDVNVVKVNTVRVKGKYKRLRMKEQGKRSDWKKAIVTLKEGQSINLI